MNLEYYILLKINIWYSFSINQLIHYKNIQLINIKLI